MMKELYTKASVHTENPLQSPVDSLLPCIINQRQLGSPMDSMPNSLMKTKMGVCHDGTRRIMGCRLQLERVPPSDWLSSEWINFNRTGSRARQPGSFLPSVLSHNLTASSSLALWSLPLYYSSHVTRLFEGERNGQVPLYTCVYM